MENFYAICPFCGKSIFVEKNLSGGFACPLCAQALGIEFLQEQNLIVDVKAENEEYDLGQQYFINTDFMAAGEHFAKALMFNQNNYLADYYARLCNIYENEGKSDFDLSNALVMAIKSSILKMTLSQAALDDKLTFVNTILNQAYILLLGNFNNLFAAYEKMEKWSELRHSALLLAASIKELTLIDKELLMVYDPNIVKSLINIADLGVMACQKLVASHLVGNDDLSVPTDFEFNKAKSFFSMFNYYATSLNKNYNYSVFKPDYTANLLFNESVITQVDKYYSANKLNQKKYLSTAGRDLDALLRSCKTALKFSFYNCFKGLVNPKNDQARIALINESVSFCLEVLKPRISIGDEKKVTVSANNFKAAIEISTYLNAFLSEFSEYNRRLASEYISKFYEDLFESTKLYFSIVYNSYNKFVNKIKELQNAEFRYYKNFLYQTVCCSSLALKDIISFDQHKMGYRLKVLKQGKQVAEEFLLLCDYKVEELEQSVKYADILDIFNALDNSLVILSGK